MQVNEEKGKSVVEKRGCRSSTMEKYKFWGLEEGPWACIKALRQLVLVKKIRRNR